MTHPHTDHEYQTVSGYLSHDHDVLDAMLEDVALMVADGELERAEHHFADFAVKLRRHIAIEEELLFPEFERATGLVQGPTAVMRQEHVAIQRELEAIAGALARGDAAGFEAGRGALEAVLGPLVGGLISDVTFPLPSMEGFGVTDLDVAAAGTPPGWFGLFAQLGTVSYAGGGGCGESSSCAGGCNTGGVPGLLVLLPALVVLRRRR